MAFSSTSLKELLGGKGYIRGPFGSALKRGELKDIGIPVYEQQHAISGIRDFRFYIDKQKHEELKRFTVEANDLIISCSGTVGRVSVIGENDPKGIISQALLILRPNANKILPEFLYYFLTSPKGFYELINASHGAVQQNIAPRDVVEKILVPSPATNEQKNIVRVLKSLDDKIVLNRHMNETLEAIARAMFKSWFVDFDPVRAKMSGEPPESICQRLGLTPDLLALFPDRFVDSDLGEIPEGWEAHGLNSMATLITKSVAPSAKPDEVFEHYSIPAFDAGATPSYEFGSTIKSNKYIVSPNAVLVSKLNPETPRIWLPSVKTANAVCSTEFMQLEPRFDCIRSFLYLLMNAETMQTEILKRVTGSTGSRQRAQPSQIAVLPIVVPTQKVVKAFDLLIKPMLGHAMTNVDQSQTLAALRDVLLPKLLSGELRIEAETPSRG